jgi:hypothetical protein
LEANKKLKEFMRDNPDLCSEWSRKQKLQELGTQIQAEAFAWCLESPKQNVIAPSASSNVTSSLADARELELTKNYNERKRELGEITRKRDLLDSISYDFELLVETLSRVYGAHREEMLDLIPKKLSEEIRVALSVKDTTDAL